jgi:hypothetical protein
MEKRFKIFVNNRIFMKRLTCTQVTDFINNVVNWNYLNLIDNAIYHGVIEGLGSVDIIYDFDEDLSATLPVVAEESFGLH